MRQQYDKVVTDPIHGQMRMDSYCWALIDTPQFQRLRDLKQLGSAYFVFPGASHNRFEHSLGVGHLANMQAMHLHHLQRDLDMDQFDIKCVTLAGLAHDLGHGPFSHIFDGHFIPRVRPGSNWKHEDASERMLEHAVKANGLTDDQISEDELKFIKALIRGHESNGSANQKQFLFDIVNNKRNSIDVDKFDYIGRDSLYLGMKCGFDYQRSMQFTRVVDNQICWNKNEALNLNELFHTRYNLFKQVYCHKVGKTVELMLTDVLCLADEHLGISAAIDDNEQYTYLTDAILREIERSKAPELKDARALMKRIRLRDLYRCADTFLLPTEMATRVTKQNFTKERILAYATESEMNEIRKSRTEIYTDYLVLSWCFGKENPIDRCRFYNKFDVDTSFTLSRSQLSQFIPHVFQEITLRVFVSKDDRVAVTLQNVFRRFIDNLESEYPASADPAHLPVPENITVPMYSESSFDSGGTLDARFQETRRILFAESSRGGVVVNSSDAGVAVVNGMTELLGIEQEEPESVRKEKFRTPTKKTGSAVVLERASSGMTSSESPNVALVPGTKKKMNGPSVLFGEVGSVGDTVVSVGASPQPLIPLRRGMNAPIGEARLPLTPRRMKGIADLPDPERYVQFRQDSPQKKRARRDIASDDDS
ncbi:hypothetical protein CcCBS67573_g01082 [Chytriomyces confervae]|uniref:HD domain-containing protein n=1 Tax=Chytriomyces confervae TaxID=246404 RepID=A0A507FPZ2_9FUNG|nr:SAM domain and HD [Chytriomyces hyalinus]TPX77645.1 hypothetical protein CcCBS67573_g01082 [Chytriomyces confervae]